MWPLPVGVNPPVPVVVKVPVKAVLVLLVPTANAEEPNVRVPAPANEPTRCWKLLALSVAPEAISTAVLVGGLSPDRVAGPSAQLAPSFKLP